MTAVLLDRRGLLCDQAIPALTGIDFVQVVDPADQTELLVFFVIDPTDVITNPNPPVVRMVAPGSLPLTFTGPVLATAEGGGQTAPTMIPTLAQFRSVAIGGTTRTALYLKFARPGDFSNYRLRVTHPAIDPFFNDVPFSFKQGCDTGFDCEPDCPCPPDAARDVEIDYLARDFESNLQALNDFSARHYPEWGERITADQGVMVQELLAALADEFAYVQDRYTREMAIETATQRRSLVRLASLVDYHPDPGCNASTLLSLDVAAQPIASNAIVLDFADRLTFWAVPEGRPPIPFELGESLADTGALMAHSTWNAMALHMPDAGQPCLAAGATSCLIAPTPQNARLPLDSQIPAGGALGGQSWLGRTMILWSRPVDPGVPVRAWPVTITSVDHTAVDPLIPFTPGTPLRLMRIGWAADQALPDAIRIEETVLLGNVALASAGRTMVDRFRIGAADLATMPADVAALPRAVERQGPANSMCCERGITMLHGLAASEEFGVAHCGAHGLDRHRIPDIRLTDLDALGNPAEAWPHETSLIAAHPDERVFTLDHGIVRPVVRYLRNGAMLVHSEYASDAGYTIRFGGGEFGRTPADGTVFEVTVRSHIGRRSNVGANAVRVIDPPDGSAPSLALAAVVAVRNPIAASGGTDPESAERIRQNAPEAFRALPLNAVRDTHYREIVERDLAWVQRAGARTRWTGSWLSTFVTADPVDAFAYSAAQRRELADLVDAIRMAGHDAMIRDPRYIPIDLEITLCVMPGHYAGHVREAVVEALAGGGTAGAPAFFDPDNFTFGQSLFRESVEAAAQAVPGVLGVTGLCVRERGVRAWRPFAEPELRVAANEILRLDNDPARPERGTLRVRVTETADDDTGCVCCT